MRFRPAHQSMINRRHDGRASRFARQSLQQMLERKPRIYLPATCKGGHERLENLAHGSRLPPTRLDRKSCSAARSRLSSFGVWRRGTRRIRTLLRLQHKELVGTRFGTPDFALAARELPRAGITVG